MLYQPYLLAYCRDERVVRVWKIRKLVPVMWHAASAIVVSIKNYAQNCAWNSPFNRFCVVRCSVQYPPTPFLEEIFCLAVITGESCDSGHDPGSDQKVK